MLLASGVPKDHTMPLIHVDIHDSDGAVLDVLIGPSASRRQQLVETGDPAPAARPYRLLVDTGASRTILDPSVVVRAGLQQDGTTELVTPSTGSNAKTVREFRCCLTIQAQGVEMEIPELVITEAPMKNQGVHGVLGRDVLRRLLVVWDGNAKSATIGF
jgi:predicted aspartyl protease